MPGSVQAVLNRTDKTNTNKNPPIKGTTIVSFSYKYGQLKMKFCF